MKIKDIGILLYPNNRAKAYLQNLCNNELFPSYAILIENDFKAKGIGAKEKIESMLNSSFDLSIPLKETLYNFKIPTKRICADDCNDPTIIDAIKQREESYFIYTGGGILKKEILNQGKKFIHVHPGIVPYYRGSTCFFYSYINEEKCGATAFFMEEDLDKGDILLQKEYNKEQIKNLDSTFELHMRSDLLLDLMNNYIKENKFNPVPQKKEEGETYYIMHPVLRHLAVLMIKKYQI